MDFGWKEEEDEGNKKPCCRFFDFDDVVSVGATRVLETRE